MPSLVTSSLGRLIGYHDIPQASEVEWVIESHGIHNRGITCRTVDHCFVQALMVATPVGLSFILYVPYVYLSLSLYIYS